jgi:hypothetical protein
MITSLDDVSDFPLCWPENKPRVAQRVASSFYATTLAKSISEIERELHTYKALRFVVSMAPAYRRTKSDPAVAVWFEIQKRGASTRQLRVIGCDKYNLQEDNAHAVALTLKGLRAFERYGTYTTEQALEGASAGALPPPDDYKPQWRTVFGDIPSGLAKDEALAVIERRYRTMAKSSAEDEISLRRLNLAIEAARAELGEVQAAE